MKTVVIPEFVVGLGIRDGELVGNEIVEVQRPYALRDAWRQAQRGAMDRCGYHVGPTLVVECRGRQSVAPGFPGLELI
jgi:hypothetical protein